LREWEIPWVHYTLFAYGSDESNFYVNAMPFIWSPPSEVFKECRWSWGRGEMKNFKNFDVPFSNCFIFHHVSFQYFCFIFWYFLKVFHFQYKKYLMCFIFQTVTFFYKCFPFQKKFNYLFIKNLSSSLQTLVNLLNEI
jgi:hypothetical protein